LLLAGVRCRDFLQRRFFQLRAAQGVSPAALSIAGGQTAGTTRESAAAAAASAPTEAAHDAAVRRSWCKAQNEPGPPGAIGRAPGIPD
jgi:hypothetical protein